MTSVKLSLRGHQQEGAMTETIMIRATQWLSFRLILMHAASRLENGSVRDLRGWNLVADGGKIGIRGRSGFGATSRREGIL